MFVLITFPARAAFDLLQAYAKLNDEISIACGPCDACQSTPYIVRSWLNYTPEFLPIVVAVPLTLSLWMLTKGHARARLIAVDVQRARAGDRVKLLG